jgi:hypothetical protein
VDLLFVSLDGVDVADLGLAGIAPELSEGPALTKKVPALVERLFDVRETGYVLGCLVFAQHLLLINQSVDPLIDIFVNHDETFLTTAPTIQLQNGSLRM